MAIKLNIYNQKAETVGEIDLSERVFGVKAKEDLVHQVMVAQMANERKVLAHTKDRSEVRGGGKKPWAQKGTGRARAGSNRSPIWIGGGVTFGPRNERNFKKKVNKKMKQKAYLMVFSDRVRQGNLLAVDSLAMKDFKTKDFSRLINNLEKIIKNKKDQKTEPKKRSYLIVNHKKDIKTANSGRNIAGLKIINIDNINILDMLKFRVLIMTKEAIKKIEKKYNK